MTKLGKLFVFVQFILSIGLLTVAVVTFTFHARGRAKNEHYFQPQIKANKERIDVLAAARDRAEARYMQSTTQLAQLEGFRPAAQNWYAAKFALTKTGKNAQGQDVPDPVRALEYQQADEKNIDTRTFFYNPTFLGPVFVEHRGKRAAAYDKIQESIRSRQNVIAQQQQAIKEALDKYAELTKQLNGDDGQLKGLYKERDLMELARKRAIEEQEALKPALANRYSEAVLVLKRQNALLQRKSELEKVGVAAGNAP